MSKVKVNFDTLPVKFKGTFKTTVQFLPNHSQTSKERVGNERMNPIDFGHRVKGQGQLWQSACETLWA